MRIFCTRILILALCLSLCGCASQVPSDSTGSTTAPVQTQLPTQQTTAPTQPATTAPTAPSETLPTDPAPTQPTQPEQTQPAPTEPQPTEPQPAEPQPTQPDSGSVIAPTVPKEEEKTTLTLGNVGAVRITYSVNVSSVRYITSASQLPDYPELAAYDDAYFETGALVLVMESVSSSSVRVGIESIELTETHALVTLTHESSGDVTVPAMATWLVWAEVEKNLSYTWEVVNPALESNVQDS